MQEMLLMTFGTFLVYTGKINEGEIRRSVHERPTGLTETTANFEYFNPEASDFNTNGGIGLKYLTKPVLLDSPWERFTCVYIAYPSVFQPTVSNMCLLKEITRVCLQVKQIVNNFSQKEHSTTYTIYRVIQKDGLTS